MRYWNLSAFIGQRLLPFVIPYKAPWTVTTSLNSPRTEASCRGRVRKKPVSTHSVLPLFFKSVFKLSDLLLKALNPSSELGGCQVLLLVFVGAQRGAAASVRGTGRVSFPGVVTACWEGCGGRGVWYGGCLSSQIKASPLRSHFVTLSSVYPAF